MKVRNSCGNLRRRAFSVNVDGAHRHFKIIRSDTFFSDSQFTARKLRATTFFSRKPVVKLFFRQVPVSARASIRSHFVLLCTEVSSVHRRTSTRKHRAAPSPPAYSDPETCPVAQGLTPASPFDLSRGTGAGMLRKQFHIHTCPNNVLEAMHNENGRVPSELIN